MEESKEKEMLHLEVISPEKVEKLINRMSMDTPENNDVKEEGVDIEVVKEVLKTLSGQTAGTALATLASAAMLLPAPILMMLVSILDKLVKASMQEAFFDMLKGNKKHE